MGSLFSKYFKNCCTSTDLASDDVIDERKCLTIKQWLQPLMSRSMKLNDDNCAICRGSLKQACEHCIAAGALEICSVKISRCGHAFHAQCIDEWLLRKQVCPLDNKEWELSRMQEIPTSKKLKC